MDRAVTGFRLPRLLLPRPGIDLRKWAVIACDQHTAEPAYWEQVAREVGTAPSTLELILPEVYLDAADTDARIARIRQSMRRYLADGVFVGHDGAVLVERTVDGRTRRGLMLELDLEHYDYAAGSTSLIRPTEGTIVERLAPRIAVRRDAPLELPHILVLIDDPQRTVIEPLAAARDHQRPLYETELMLGGGHLVGRALDATQGAQAVRSLQALADPRAFAARYGVPDGTPAMLFAMGDGNHSLATAKAIWRDARERFGMAHPSRYALVEVVNVHDPALEFAAIHRLLFGVAGDTRHALAQAFGSRVVCTDVASAAQMRERVAAAAGSARVTTGLIGPGARFSVVQIADPPSPLAVATWQPFIDSLIERRLAHEVDYVHGDAALERLALQAGRVGVHFAPIGKSELMRRVVHEGPTPRKTFSMGEAHEKRYYVEARRIGD
ncbi:MAG: DUF1015 domain-containing protein [Burkholderiaceae bacterium]|nr:DUF1015 domain-containing protein [Burkholderiaceae bacterium]